MAITSTQQTAIMKTTSALFNKAFSPEHVTNFVTFYENNGSDLGKLADALIGSSVYEAQYAGAATVAEYGAILMAKYNMTYGGTSAADTAMTNFVNYSFEHAADSNSLRTIQAVDKYLVATLIPSITAGNVFETMNQAIENKAVAAIEFKNNPENSGTEMSLASITDDVSTIGVPGQTFMLTAGVDNAPAFTGGAGNDIYTAVIDGTATTGINNQTWTALDNLDGAAGTDILNINNISAAAKDATTLSLGTIANIETINIQSVAGITKTDNTYTADAADGTVGNGTEVDFSSISGLTTINATKSTAALVKAAATTDVNVSGATGLISVVGGKNVSVTDATTGNAITVGNGAASGDAAGTITITDTDNSGANAISVEGGTNVTVTATSKAAAGNITIGDATNGTASGDVVVTQNLNNNGVSALTSEQTITVTGGKTVAITQNANSIAELATSDADITTGAVAVTANDATTDVTVKAIANITNVTKDAVDEVKGTTAVTFKDVAAGDIVTVNSLVFTAAKNLTAAEVAQAFANLTAADTQSTGGVVGNGIYTAGLAAGFTSGAANGATVVFTNTAGTAAPTMTITATDSSAAAKASALPTTAPTTGTAAVIYDKSLNDVVYNTVNIKDNATASIQNISVDGATGVTLGTGGSLDALKTLSLANVSGATGITSGVSTLDMTLNKVSGAITLNTALTSLNLNSTGTASTSAMASTTLKNLTIDAAAALNVSGGTMMSTAAGLENITVKGTAAVTLGTVASTALKSFDASANTGGVTATIDAQTAGSSANLTKFVFSAGNDVVTTGNAVVNKEIDLGAGNDKITLATSSTGITAAIKGGADTDTIAMEAATAATLLVGAPAAANFTEKVTGFERLELTTATATDTALTIDLAAIGGYNYVTTKGTGDSTNATTAITLNNMANNGTVVLTAANGVVANGSGIVVNVKDADTVDSTLNTVISSSGDLDAGLLTAQNVKTVNINIVDTQAAPQTINSNDLILTANAATTVKVTGTANLDLVLTGSTKVTLVDASELNGGLTATTAVNTTTATTIKGGSGIDELTATSNNDVLIGGAGDDTLIVTSGNLVQLHGGEGKDTYVIGTTSNQSAFATINGTAAELSGDVIEFGIGAQKITFSTAKLVLDADVASFDSYVNLASNQTAGQVSYFQWLGNTYLVQDADGAAGTFVAGTDTIVKITGLVDFTFNDNIGTTNTVLEIA